MIDRAGAAATAPSPPTDLEYIERVGKMTETELLDEIIENPEYLTDSYYRDLRQALRTRYYVLLGKRSKG